MALAIASVATATVNNNNTVVVTKPTGLAAGDLMLAYIFSFDGTVNIPNTPAGWTSVHTISQSSNEALNVVWKIADSADAAASNFSFTVTDGDTSDFTLGYIYRITSTGTLPANPIVSSDTDTDTNASTNPTFDITLNSYNADNIIVAFFLRDNATTSASNYVITGGTNPTWTERLDNSSGSDFGYAMASADAEQIAAFTSFELDTVASNNNNALSILVVSELQNASADVGYITAAPTIFGITGSNTANGSVGHLTITPTINGLDTKASSDSTQWTNPDKPSTTWTNPNK